MLALTVASCSQRWEPLKEALALLGKGELTLAAREATQVKNSAHPNQATFNKADSILEICHRIRRDFNQSADTLIARMHRRGVELDLAMLDKLEQSGKLDGATIDGKRYYFSHAVGNLFLLDSSLIKQQKDWHPTPGPSPSIAFRIGHASKVVTKTDSVGKAVQGVAMKLKYTIRVKPDVVPAGEVVRCWMPFPRENHERQRTVRLIATNPERHLLSPENTLQRSIYLEKKAVAHQPLLFSEEFTLVACAQSYHLSPQMVQPYRTRDPLYLEHTGERPPHLVFSAKIRSLSDSIVGGETNPLVKVRKIYEYIDQHITWASALEYSIMPDIPGFVLERRHGDCGMQTLLFMSLARAAGIPVHWQSGWMLHPGEVNLHDWCEVYYEGVGWVPLDQSFGRLPSDDPAIRYFYMTGIDAYRLIVNDDFAQPLFPEKKFLRSEPYDFQRGEVEWKGGNLYFDTWNWDMEVTYLTGDDGQAKK